MGRKKKKHRRTKQLRAAHSIFIENTKKFKFTERRRNLSLGKKKPP